MGKFLLRLMLIGFLIIWAIAAMSLELPAPSSSQGALVFPYTILYTLLFIPKVLIAGVMGL